MQNIDYLLPGEDLMGFIWRLYKLSPYPIVDDVFEYLGLNKQKVSAGDYQSVSEVFLSKRFSSKIEDPLYMHGHWRIFDYCLTQNQQQERYKNIEAGNSKKIPIHASSTLNDISWRWCNQCTTEDTDAFGVSYFKRDHQVRGVFNCKKHNLRLLSGCTKCGWEPKTLRTFNHPVPLCPNCGCQFVDQAPEFSKNLLMVEKIASAMANGSLKMNYKQIVNQFKHYIGIEYLTPEDSKYRVLVREFNKHLAMHFTFDELSICFQGITPKNSQNRARALRTNKFYRYVDNATLPMSPVAMAFALAFLDSETSTMRDQMAA
jgi:hypothetical protein